MEILIKRKWRGKQTTLSVVTVNGIPYHFALEDTDRGLHSDMSLDEILKTKIKGRTAIPIGRYQVIVNHSPRFGRMMPLLMKVPGYSGIRIHSGNRHEHTDGCILPGLTYFVDSGDYVVASSLTSTERLYKAINEALKNGEEVWLTIEAHYA